jgi:hypothetical protein
VALGDEAQIKSLQISKQLHEALPTLILYNDITMGSFKSQFKKADKANADFAIILGEEELNNNQVAIKPLKGQGEQQAMRIEDAINYLKVVLESIKSNALNPMQNQRWGKGCRPFFRPNHRSGHPHISWLLVLLVEKTGVPGENH